MMHRIARLLSMLLAAFLLSFAAQAQDEIHLKNGDVIEAKVRELTPSVIKYQKAENGPTYTVNRRDVRRVVYENGATDEMDNRRTGSDGDNTRGRFAPGPNASKFGQNVIALLPIAMTDRSVGGFGLRYERTLDKEGYLSAVLPMVVSLRSVEEFDPITGNSNNSSTNPFYQFYPGLRFYPATSKHAFAYALGVNLMAGFGKEEFTDRVYQSNGTWRYTTVNTTNTRLGVMLSNSLNFAPMPRLHIGLEFMLGFRYVNNYTNNYDPDESLFETPIVNFNLGVGYRF